MRDAYARNIDNIRSAFACRNARDPLFRTLNRALCRYWIGKERERRKSAQARARLIGALL